MERSHFNGPLIHIKCSSNVPTLTKSIVLLEKKRELRGKLKVYKMAFVLIYFS